MKRLFAALEIPEEYVCPQGTVATGMEALMVLLRRFAYPNRWCELTSLFGRTEPELSQIFNTVSTACTYIYKLGSIYMYVNDIHFLLDFR